MMGQSTVVRALLEAAGGDGHKTPCHSVGKESGNADVGYVS